MLALAVHFPLSYLYQNLTTCKLYFTLTLYWLNANVLNYNTIHNEYRLSQITNNTCHFLRNDNYCKIDGIRKLFFNKITYILKVNISFRDMTPRCLWPFSFNSCSHVLCLFFSCFHLHTCYNSTFR